MECCAAADGNLVFQRDFFLQSRAPFSPVHRTLGNMILSSGR